MKFKQEQLEFKPISIILETKQEAERFVSIIDKVEEYKLNGTQFTLTEDEWYIIIEVSNAFFDKDVVV